MSRILPETGIPDTGFPDTGHRGSRGPQWTDGVHYPDRPRRRIKLEPQPQTSRSLAYGVSLLAFTAEQPAWQASELAGALGSATSLDRPSRHAQMLVALGYLEQDKKSRYRLAVRAGEPGRSIVGTLCVEAPAASTILEDLREETGHTVSLAALDGTYALYLQRFHAHGPGQFEADLQQGVGVKGRPSSARRSARH